MWEKQFSVVQCSKNYRELKSIDFVPFYITALRLVILVETTRSHTHMYNPSYSVEY